jgi:hypothetical protein
MLPLEEAHVNTVKERVYEFSLMGVYSVCKSNGHFQFRPWYMDIYCSFIQLDVI